MSTKKPKRSCTVPAGRGPTEVQYARAVIELWTPTATASPVGIPDPHNPPPYGGKCYRQSYAESQAYLALMQAVHEYLSAAGAPKATRDAAASKYIKARFAYLDAWNAMETCLRPVIA